MKSKSLVGLCACSALFLLSGCSQRLVDFTVISTKNVPLTDEAPNLQKANSRVKGTDAKLTVLFIPFGIPDMKEAIDKAIEKYPGAVALTDGVVYSKWWSCLIAGQNKYVVEGTPLYPVATTHASTTNYQPAPATQQPAATEAMRIVHVVKRGETLSSIAPLYSVSVPQILKWNRLSSAEITEGSQLVIYIK